MPRLALHAIFAATILTGYLSGAAGESASPAPPGDVVELPTLTVTDNRELPQPEKWRYTQVGGFEVISSASDRESRRLLRSLELFQMALSIAWPMQIQQPPPTSIILCGRLRDFPQFIPEAEKSTSRNRASLTLNNHEQAFIVLDLGTKTVSLDPSAIEPGPDGSIATDFDVDHYKQLYREYVRYLFSQSTNRPPVWLEEGLCQIIMKMEFDKRLVIFGRLQDPNAISAAQAVANSQNEAAAEAGDTGTAVAAVEDLDFNAALKRRRLLGFDEFFGVTRDSETARNPLGNNMWAKQCYAFVHLCLYGQGGKFKAAFEKFRDRTYREPATEALFTECFGKPYKKFLVDLRSYIDFTNYEQQRFKITGENALEAPLPEMRDATEGEYTRIKGDALRVAGHLTAARDSLIAAYIRGERSPAFLATLGQAERAAGNTDRAHKFLEAAAPKSIRPSVLLDLAATRIDVAVAPVGGSARKLSDPQLVSVLKPLFVARTLPPAKPEVYVQIARAWLNASSSPKPENFSVLAEGLKLFPRHLDLIYSTAELYVRINEKAPARALAEHGEKVAANDGDRARFTELKATLPPLPAASSAR